MAATIDTLTSSQRTRLKQVPRGRRDEFLGRYLRTYDNFGISTQADLANMRTADPEKFASFRKGILTVNNHAGGSIAHAKHQREGGFFNSTLGKVVKVAAIAAGAYFGAPMLSSALGGSLSSGAVALASKGALIPSSAFASTGIGASSLMSGLKLASTANSITGLFNGKEMKINMPKAVNGGLTAPTIEDPAAQQAIADEQERLKKQRGRAGTMLTGRVSGDDSGLATKMLLGG